jgi:hypothetical protein
MGINRERWNNSLLGENNVRCFVTYSRKRSKVGVSIRNLRPESLNDGVGGRDDILRFGFKVINWPDDPFYLLESSGREGGERRIEGKELRSDLIDFFISALGGEHHGDEEVILILKIELRMRIGIELRERFDERGSFLGGHRAFLSTRRTVVQR